jgi:hypothetical protein
MARVVSLASGLFFNDVEEWLPWGCATSTARYVLGLESYRTDPRTLVWEDRLILGGLCCDIHAKFLRLDPEDRFGPRFLRYLLFYPVLSGMNIQDSFYRTRDYLLECFGPTHTDSLGPQVLHPFSNWQLGETMVVWKISGQANNFICMGEIWKLPLPREILEHTRME